MFRSLHSRTCTGFSGWASVSRLSAVRFKRKTNWRSALLFQSKHTCIHMFSSTTSLAQPHFRAQSIQGLAFIRRLAVDAWPRPADSTNNYHGVMISQVAFRAHHLLSARTRSQKPARSGWRRVLRQGSGRRSWSPQSASSSPTPQNLRGSERLWEVRLGEIISPGAREGFDACWRGHPRSSGQSYLKLRRARSKGRRQNNPLRT